jgi:hypothetical protein
MATKDFEKRQKKKIARAKTAAKVDEIKRAKKDRRAKRVKSVIDSARTKRVLVKGDRRLAGNTTKSKTTTNKSKTTTNKSKTTTNKSKVTVNPRTGKASVKSGGKKYTPKSYTQKLKKAVNKKSPTSAARQLYRSAKPLDVSPKPRMGEASRMREQAKPRMAKASRQETFRYK